MDPYIIKNRPNIRFELGWKGERGRILPQNHPGAFPTRLTLDAGWTASAGYPARCTSAQSIASSRCTRWPCVSSCDRGYRSPSSAPCAPCCRGDACLPPPLSDRRVSSGCSCSPRHASGCCPRRSVWRTNKTNQIQVYDDELLQNHLRVRQ